MRPSRHSRLLENIEPARIPIAELLESGRPAVLRGLAREWPLVRKGSDSVAEAIAYLRRFCVSAPVVLYRGAPQIRGRFFYDETLQGFNFQRTLVPLAPCLDRLGESTSISEPESLYVGSTDVDLYLPGFRAENDLAWDPPSLERNRPTVSIWIGNRTVATAHFDESHNLACCAVGHRRFSLFPPEQVRNLYPGPLDPTPGGQIVSMVDFDAPDFDRHPGFRDALEAGEIAELEPGDVLFIPALWWHHVEALDPFNVLVNYWWNTAPAYVDSPHLTLLHALLSLRSRPDAQKAAWRELFEYYVFGPSDTALEHLPQQARGNLGPMDEMRARRLRAQLLNRLNR